jgi:hypothetical protein
VADQHRDIDGRLRGNHRALVSIDRIKAERVGAQQIQRRLGLLHHKRRQRNAAVAGDHRGDALRHLGQHLGVVKHNRVVVCVHINKTRRDGQTRAIHPRHIALRQTVGQLAPQALAHGGDTVTHQQDIAGQSGIARSINYQPVFKQGRTRHLILLSFTAVTVSQSSFG